MTGRQTGQSASLKVTTVHYTITLHQKTWNTRVPTREEKIVGLPNLPVLWVDQETALHTKTHSHLVADLLTV